METFLFELLRRKWLFVAFALGTLIAILPIEGLEFQGRVILGIAAGSMVIFITEPIPLPTVALLIAILQVLFNIDTPKHVAQSFMSDSVFFIMGSLMIAVAFVKQKLDRRMAYYLLKATGGSTLRFAIGVLISASFLAALIGEHTVAAILLPVCIVVIRKVEEREGADKNLVRILLFALAYGATVAGVGTPSGGARNAIMIQYLHDLKAIDVGYLRWISLGYPMILIIVPLIALVLLLTCKPKTKRLTVVVMELQKEVRESGKLGARDWITIGVFCLTLVLWMTVSASIGLGTVALIGAALYLVTGCVEWKDINQGVNWGAVLLYAGAMSMGVALVRWKAAEWVANNYVAFLDALGLGAGIPLIISVGILIIIVTNAMSSGAAVAVMAPVALKVAELGHVNPIVMAFVAVIASAFGFISVGSHPGITIVHSSGYLPASEFAKMGWKITLIAIVVLVLYAITYLEWMGGMMVSN